MPRVHTSRRRTAATTSTTATSGQSTYISQESASATVQPRDPGSGGRLWTRRFQAVTTIAGLFVGGSTLALREAQEKAGLPPLFSASLSADDPNIRLFYLLR